MHQSSMVGYRQWLMLAHFSLILLRNWFLLLHQLEDLKKYWRLPLNAKYYLQKKYVPNHQIKVLKKGIVFVSILKVRLFITNSIEIFLLDDRLMFKNNSGHFKTPLALQQKYSTAKNITNQMYCRDQYLNIVNNSTFNHNQFMFTYWVSMQHIHTPFIYVWHTKCSFPELLIKVNYLLYSKHYSTRLSETGYKC